MNTNEQSPREKMKSKLTVSQAIAEGFTCALNEDAEYYVKLEDLQQDQSTLNYQTLYLGSKETFNFSISAKAIEQMIEEYIDNQDEVNNENEHLYDQLNGIDFKAIADLINPHFLTDYHSVTEIQVIKDHE